MSLINLPKKKQAVNKSTWALRPTSAQVGQKILITDVGPSEEIFQWNGTRWFPINGQLILSSKAPNVSVTGTTTITQLDSVNIPAGLMSANGQIEILTLWSYTNSANAKTIRVYLGAVLGTSFMSRAETATVGSQMLTVIRAANSTTAQKGANNNIIGGLGISNAGITSSTFDMSLVQPIIFTGTLALSTETITLKGYKITYRE